MSWHWYIFSAAVLLANCNSAWAICQAGHYYQQIEGECDSYIECKDEIAHEMLCADGLYFNPRALAPGYPCGYPQDIECSGKTQPAQATLECPRQYGFYPASTLTDNCGEYTMCVFGHAVPMLCPPGLAFNVTSARCDWPDLVSTCDVVKFLNFSCPRGADGQVIEHNYKYPGSCYAFYSCERETARVLTCDDGFAFDASKGLCIEEYLVPCKED